MAAVHPDTGGAGGEAGERISDLLEARRILLVRGTLALLDRPAEAC